MMKPHSWCGAVFISGAAIVAGCSSDTASDKHSATSSSGDTQDAATKQAKPEFAAFALAKYPEPKADPSNALLADESKRPLAEALGHRIFFDPRFSGPLLDPDHRAGSQGALGAVGDVGKIACASCHVPESGFVDTRSPRSALSLGASWTPRKALSLLDVGYREGLLMWDGRHDAAWNQVFTPFETHLELNSGRLYIAQQIAKDAQYKSSYEAIFGALPPLLNLAEYPQIARTGCLANKDDSPTDCHGMPGDKAEYDALSPEKKDAVTRIVVNLGKAIQAYERQMRCGTSRFDAWAFGDASALNESEQRGAALFAGKGKCASCHSGPFMTDGTFHNIGLRPAGPQVLFMDPKDPGAKSGVASLLNDPLSASQKFSDDTSVNRFTGPVPDQFLGAFKTPSLRCLSSRRSFFHTGQARTLADVVAFKAQRGDPDGFVGVNELQEIGLNEAEQGDLVAFLQSLDGLPGTGTPAKYLVAP